MGRFSKAAWQITRAVDQPFDKQLRFREAVKKNVFLEGTSNQYGMQSHQIEISWVRTPPEARVFGQLAHRRLDGMHETVGQFIAALLGVPGGPKVEVGVEPRRLLNAQAHFALLLRRRWRNRSK